MQLDAGRSEGTGTHVRSRDDAEVTRRGGLAGHGTLGDFDHLTERGLGLDPLQKARRTRTVEAQSSVRRGIEDSCQSLRSRRSTVELERT